jgi:hypothetical protein
MYWGTLSNTLLTILAERVAWLTSGKLPTRPGGTIDGGVPHGTLGPIAHSSPGGEESDHNSHQRLGNDIYLIEKLHYITPFFEILSYRTRRWAKSKQKEIIFVLSSCA